MAMDAVTKFFGIAKNDQPQDQIQNLDLDLLQVNPFQPRKNFDHLQLEELARSIAELGVIQPVVVRRDGEGYQLVSGERRLRAAKLAGLQTIPAVVRSFSDQEMALIALVENLQRADLNYFEEAEGFRKLIDEFKLTQEEVAARVGKSQPTVANKLRLLKIDPAVKANIMVELLTERHVRALLKLKSAEDQLLLMKEIYERDLSVKDTEELIAEYIAGRVQFGDETAEEAGPESEGEKQRQHVRRLFSDMRIYVNTIKAAVSSIEESGISVKMDKTETEEYIQLTITIPRDQN